MINKSSLQREGSLQNSLKMAKCVSGHYRIGEPGAYYVLEECFLERSYKENEMMHMIRKRYKKGECVAWMEIVVGWPG